jgi:hypothetical protein
MSNVDLDRVIREEIDPPPRFEDDVRVGVEPGVMYHQSFDPGHLFRMVDAWERIVRDEQFETSAADFRVAALRQLAAARSWSFARMSRREDVDRAIVVTRRALEVVPAGSDDEFSLRNDLACSLSDRYDQYGDMSDLEEGARLLERVVSETPAGHEALSGRLNNLAGLLRDVYNHTRREADFDRFFDAQQRAEEAAARDSPDLPTLWKGLAGALAGRAGRSGDVDDLNRAIELLQRAVDRVRPDSPDRPGFLNDLAAAIHQRFELLRSADGVAPVSHLERARDLLNEAAAASSASPVEANVWHNLAEVLRDLYEATREEGDARDTARAYERATEVGTRRAVYHALRAGRDWGNWALSRGAWAEAAGAFQGATNALQLLYSAQLLHHGRGAWLALAKGIASHAAFALARASDLEGAAAALESNRGRLLKGLLGPELAVLERLAIAHPELRQHVGVRLFCQSL